MSLDQAILHKKEKRKPYKGAKAVDKTCRNHGSCSWCQNDRLYHTLKSLEASDEKRKEYEGGSN